MTSTAENSGGRIGWLERPDDDFPYYRGVPIAIAPAHWVILAVAILVALYILIYPPEFLRGGGLMGIVRGILLFLIPLLALIFVAPKGWTALFRPLRGIDFVWMVAFALLNLAITLLVGSFLIHAVETTSNAAVAGASSATMADQIMLFLRAIPQLFGEELVSILPFLGILTFLVHVGTGRTLAIIVAMLLTGVLFAAMHLPTYGFNIIQTLGGVGIARLVLLLPYIMTKNIWVSSGAHILNDWLFFGISIAGSAAAAGATAS